MVETITQSSISSSSISRIADEDNKTTSNNEEDENEVKGQTKANNTQHETHREEVKVYLYMLEERQKCLLDDHESSLIRKNLHHPVSVFTHPFRSSAAR